MQCVKPVASDLEVESAGVATGLGASLLLEPGDELGDGEGLGEGGAIARAVARSRSGRGRRSGLLRLRAGDRGGRRDWRGSLGGSSRRDGGRRGLGGSRGSRGRARAGALPDGRSGDLVGGGAVVHIEEDTWVGGGVGLGHVNTSAGERSRAAGDGDLPAAVVELGTALPVTLVQGDDLRADVVLALSDIRKGDGDLALVGDELIDSPLAARETLLEDLGPDSALTLGVSLSHVDHDRALVGGGNGLVLVPSLGLGVVVVPLEGDLGTSLHGDEVSGGLSTVADHERRGHILDGVVAVAWGLDSEVLTLVLSANDERLEGSVASDELGSSDGKND